MPPRTLHFCQFGFDNEDIRVVGTELDGGTSLNGLSDPIAIDGGGYWQADFGDADFGGPDDDDRAVTLAWRAINAGLSGGGAGILHFCDRHHQPVRDRALVPHNDQTPFDDTSDYASSGATSRVLAVLNGQAGGLNATILDIAITSERPLIGGERFTYVHATWRERCAEIMSLEPIPGGWRATIQPPIRGGIAAGDLLDFDEPRCLMRRSSQPTNMLMQGLWGSASITMVEDMRDPDL